MTRIAECPLCGTDFESEGCRAGCPISMGCSMTRCPMCGHEFVDFRFSILDFGFGRRNPKSKIQNPKWKDGGA